MNLFEKVAVVTAATTDIGFAVASILFARGASVCLVDADQDKGQNAVAALRPNCGFYQQCWFVPADVADPASVGEAVDGILRTAGSVDILVNVAGGGLDSLLDADDADIELLLRREMMGPIRFARALLPAMLRTGTGKIINMTCAHGAAAGPAGETCSPVEIGTVAFSRQLAQEIAGQGVSINCLCLGPTLAEHFCSDYGSRDTALPVGSPISSKVSPKIADALTFFASTASDYLTGHVINLNEDTKYAA
jgi:NAD(P)-dependent dehydrogenase (short-subunit alcohol dehydrogenase family)